MNHESHATEIARAWTRSWPVRKSGLKGGPTTAVRFRMLVGWLTAMTVLVTGIAAGPAAPPDDSTKRRPALASIIADPRYAQARWGIHVLSLDTREEILAVNAEELFVPASNTKLFTGALALQRLGPDFRIRTSLYARGLPDAHGVLSGDLVLFGRGDPSFSAAFRGGWIERALTPLVEALRQAGIRRVKGDLVADESYFITPALGSGWEWDDLQYAYGAEVSALSVHDNSVKVHVRPGAAMGDLARVFLEPASTFVGIDNYALTGQPGSARELRVVRPLNENRVWVTGRFPLRDPGTEETIAVHRPALWMGHLLRDALARAGIRIDGGVRLADAVSRALRPLAAGEWREVAAVESPPLRELLAFMLQWSQNLHAQLLWLQVGAQTRNAAEEFSNDIDVARAVAGYGSDAEGTTEQAALREMNKFLVEADIPNGQVLLEEGSGLSRRHLISPAATTRLLAFMARQPGGSIFRQSLAAPGEPGTLRSRLTGLIGGDRLRAKTGYLRYSYALSGYLDTLAGERLAFSILLNNANRAPGEPSPRADLDRLVELLAELR